MINTGLTKEQVLSSFVDANPTMPNPLTKDQNQTLNQSQQPKELHVNVLDIWSSDDEEGGPIDLWKDDKRKTPAVTKTEEKFEERAEGSESKESEKEKGKSVEKEEKEDEGVVWLSMVKAFNSQSK